MTIGIIGAMPEEISDLLKIVQDLNCEDFGKRSYYSGRINNKEVVIVLSRIGKVATASTATTLIDRFKVNSVVFTGVAGAISADLKIGDVVVANSLLQHDVDASAIMDFKKFEIPLLNKINFECCPDLIKKAVISAKKYISTHSTYGKAQVHCGIIASGDRFIFEQEDSKKLADEIQGLLAVEMEGASLAQICYEWDVPFCVIRTISDNANHSSVVDFPKFVKEFAAPFSAGIVANLLNDF